MKCSPSPRQASASLAAAAVLTMVSGLLSGCSSATEDVKPNPIEKPKPIAAAPAPPPKPKIDWDAKLEACEAKLADGDLPAAQAALAEVSASDELTDEQKERLAAAQSKLQAAKDKAESARRDQAIAQAAALIQDGDLEDAASKLSDVLTSSPTAPQKEQADKLNEKIEETRRIRRELRSAMQLLHSEKRSDVRAARSRLWQDSEVALPLLLEALQGDNPVLVGNALEVLRVFNQPERTIPAMLAVLSNPKQSACWPAAIREIEKLQSPGLGDKLLSLALAAKSPEQQVAVLTALASVEDPPRQTFLELLPLLQTDGPTLRPALWAAQRACDLHQQTDFASQRGFGGQLTSQQQQWLRELPERLRAIVAADTGQDGELGETAQAAMALGVTSRRLEAKPLPAKITRALPETPESSPELVIDGVWDTVDPEKMWRYPSGQRTMLAFDLGQERTVTGIRIWNLNQPGAAHRGWKDIEIFVSESPSLLRPVAKAVALPAPGREQAGDYSVTLSVPFVRGRYVKLEPRSVWREDGGGSGLTEIQILGY